MMWIVLLTRYWRHALAGIKRASARGDDARPGACVPNSIGFIHRMRSETLPVPDGAGSLSAWASKYSKKVDMHVEYQQGRPSKSRARREWIAVVPLGCHAVVMLGDTCVFDPDHGLREGRNPDVVGRLEVEKLD